MKELESTQRVQTRLVHRLELFGQRPVHFCPGQFKQRALQARPVDFSARRGPARAHVPSVEGCHVLSVAVQRNRKSK